MKHLVETPETQELSSMYLRALSFLLSREANRPVWLGDLAYRGYGLVLALIYKRGENLRYILGMCMIDSPASPEDGMQVCGNVPKRDKTRDGMLRLAERSLVDIKGWIDKAYEDAERKWRSRKG